VIDTVGLNDGVIARERDPEKLARYLFGRRPDLFIFPTLPNFTLATWGHGPLGNWPRWVGLPACQWEDYVYVGTTTTDSYHLNFLVRRETPQAARLRAFIATRVANLRAPEMEALLQDLRARSQAARASSPEARP